MTDPEYVEVEGRRYGVVYLRCPRCRWVSAEWVGYEGAVADTCVCGLPSDQLVPCPDEDLPPRGVTMSVVRRG